MKKLTVFATVASLCCGLNSLFGQIQVLGPGQPTLAPHLISDQNPLGEIDAPLSTIGPLDVVPNPFDYFNDAPPKNPPRPMGLIGESDVDMGASPSDSDPSSLPVGTRPQRSIVDTLVDHATLAQVPNACMAPVFWSGQCQTPNPVAEWLTRQQCVEGLWDGYQAQRAAECVCMWHHLAGYQGCGQCACAACSPCADTAAKPVLNRYKALFSHGSSNCDQCQSATLVPSPTCNPPVPRVQSQQLPAAYSVPATSRPPTPSTPTVSPQSQDNVAYLQTQLFR